MKMLMIILQVLIIVMLLSLAVGQVDCPRRRLSKSEKHMIWYWHEHPELHPGH